MEGLNQQPSLSPVAVIGLMLSMTTPLSIFCCAGLFTGFLGFAMGAFSVYQYKTEVADKTSAILGGIAMAISGAFFLVYTLATLGLFASGMIDSGALSQ